MENNFEQIVAADRALDAASFRETLAVQAGELTTEQFRLNELLRKVERGRLRIRQAQIERRSYGRV